MRLLTFIKFQEGVFLCEDGSNTQAGTQIIDTHNFLEMEK